MNCPGCGAPLQLREGCESLTCDYCRSVYLPPANDEGVRVYDQPADLACPVCAVPLVHAVIAHQSILYCKQCRGILLRMAVFVQLLNDLRPHRGAGGGEGQRSDPRELDRHTLCPRCGKKMDTHFYLGGGHVVMDDCSRCELNWLDAGELTALLRTPDHSTEPYERS